MDNTQLRAEARHLLTGRWNACALMTLIVSVTIFYRQIQAQGAGLNDGEMVTGIIR